MRKTSAILLAAALPMAVQAANTEFTFGGYVKLDAMYSQYSDGNLAENDSLRDYYVPASVPTSNGTGKETDSTDFSAKSSRFNLKSVTTLENGEKITGFFEMDFLGSSQGNELVSNSYSPRLRHAFFSYNNLTFGQTWSTFMNPAALPETVDFLGVTEGTVFVRQAQVRYTMGNFQFALENPETRYGNDNGTPNKGIQDDSSLPDIIARYNLKVGDHAFTFAAIGRQFARQDSAANVDEKSYGFGASVTGIVKLGADDLKVSVSHGQIARYVGAGTITADVVKNAAAGNNDLEATDVTAAFIAYRHFWNPKLRSTIAYSMLEADYDNEPSTGLVDKSSSARINLMYSPVKEVTYGVEYSNAKLEKVSGDDGTMNRLQFTAKYSF